MKRITLHRALAVLLTALLLCLPLAALAEEEEIYTENEWNYVDGSMDVSQGIPQNAQGVLGLIRERGVLRVATEPYFPPQEFIDPAHTGQEQYVGSDMELARLIAARMGVELEIVPMEFTEVLNAVSSGECDLAISALSYIPSRAARMSFSKGYFFTDSPTGASLMIREADLGKINGPDDLGNKTIIAQIGSVQELLLAQNVTRYREFRRVNSMQNVYQALRRGKADAAAVDERSAQVYINNNPDSHLALVPDVHFALEDYMNGDRVAGAKGEFQLMYFVNGVIDEVLSGGTYQQWYETYEAYAGTLGM